MCPHTTICVLILLYMCPHAATCVLILLYLCPHTTDEIELYCDVGGTHICSSISTLHKHAAHICPTQLPRQFFFFHLSPNTNMCVLILPVLLCAPSYYYIGIHAADVCPNEQQEIL